MLGWLYRIIIGRFSTCEHNWKKISDGEIKQDGIMKAKIMVYRCIKCGKTDKVKITVNDMY